LQKNIAHERRSIPVTSVATPNVRSVEPCFVPRSSRASRAGAAGQAVAIGMQSPTAAHPSARAARFVRAPATLADVTEARSPWEIVFALVATVADANALHGLLEVGPPNDEVFANGQSLAAWVEDECGGRYPGARTLAGLMLERTQIRDAPPELNYLHFYMGCPRASDAEVVSFVGRCREAGVILHDARGTPVAKS
jgi:hypothetical protein